MNCSWQLKHWPLRQSFVVILIWLFQCSWYGNETWWQKVICNRSWHNPFPPKVSYPYAFEVFYILIGLASYKNVPLTFRTSRTSTQLSCRDLPLKEKSTSNFLCYSIDVATSKERPLQDRLTLLNGFICKVRRSKPIILRKR